MSVAVQTIAPLHSPSPAPSAATLPPAALAREDSLGQLKSHHLFPRRTQPSFSVGSRPQPRIHTGFAPRTYRSSFIISAASTGLATLCSDCKILGCLLEFLTYQDLRNLNAISRALRRIFLDASVKDVVFARFIPGYRSALKWRDSKLWADSIRLNYADLSRLVASLNTPLHRYPMHALSVLSSDLPTWEQMETTKRLQTYARMHSRAVLFLQNMVHSNSHAGPSDLDNFQPRASVSNSQPNLRELTFPAPLSYPSANNMRGSAASPKSQSQPPSLRGSPVMSRSNGSVTSLLLLGSKNRKKHARQASESALSEPARSSPRPRTYSKLSLFSGKAQPTPLPQPENEPESLRLYSGSWRTSYYGRFSVYDDAVLKPPKRRFASTRTANHSSSSLGSSSNSPASSKHNAAITPPFNGNGVHDLSAAAKRSRAPILRVFVPCSAFTDDVVTACEDQLIEDDLWDHLSVGDIVCNFGYIPVQDDNSVSPERDRRLWLVFTGDQLQIYDHTRPPPIAGALSLSLPSPFYYSHILPTFVNPRLRLTLPPLRASFSLAPVTVRVATRQAPGGYARVKTHAWLASLDANAYCAPPDVMNPGWLGEWVLQGEGTPEGRIALQQALQGGQESECEYEIDVEKSGDGRVWLRMLTPPPREPPPELPTKDTESLRTQPSD